MKKLLALLGAATLVTSTSTVVVACGTPTNPDPEPVLPDLDGILINLKQNVNTILSDHLSNNSTKLFELEGDNNPNSYLKLNKEELEKIYSSIEEPPNEEGWKVFNGEIDDELNDQLVADLTKALNINQLSENLNQLKNDIENGYSYFLNGVNDIFKDISISRNDGYQIKKITNESEENTYQFAILIDIEWQYMNQNQLVTEKYEGYNFIFTLTNDEILKQDIDKTMAVYQKEIFENEESITHFDEKFFSLSGDSAFRTVGDELILDSFKNTGETNNNIQTLTKQVEEIMNYSIESGLIYTLESKNAKLDRYNPIDISLMFFDNSTRIELNPPSSPTTKSFYSLTENYILGADDTFSDNELKDGLTEYLIDKNVLSVFNDQITDFLSTLDISSENNNKNKYWELGFLKLTGINIAYGGSQLISLPEMLIPYSYSISGKTNNSVDDLLSPFKFYVESFHDLFELQTASENEILKVSNTSTIAKNIEKEFIQNELYNFDALNNAVVDPNLVIAFEETTNAEFKLKFRLTDGTTIKYIDDGILVHENTGQYRDFQLTLGFVSIQLNAGRSSKIRKFSEGLVYGLKIN